jgi:hypothetical protein
MHHKKRPSFLRSLRPLPPELMFWEIGKYIHSVISGTSRAEIREKDFVDSVEKIGGEVRTSE